MGEFLFSALAWLIGSLVSDVVEEFLRKHWKILLGILVLLIGAIVMLASI